MSHIGIGDHQTGAARQGTHHALKLCIGKMRVAQEYDHIGVSPHQCYAQAVRQSLHARAGQDDRASVHEARGVVQPSDSGEKDVRLRKRHARIAQNAGDVLGQKR